MKFGCVNVNSLVNKVLYLRHMIGEHDLSVIAVCKTWLVPSVSSSFVSIDEFRVVREDGSLIVIKHGCCLYVKDQLVEIDVDLLNVVAVLLLNLDVYILAIYRPPSSSLDQDCRRKLTVYSIAGSNKEPVSYIKYYILTV